jgi:hypothetical protein
MTSFAGFTDQNPEDGKSRGNSKLRHDEILALTFQDWNFHVFTAWIE